MRNLFFIILIIIILAVGSVVVLRLDADNPQPSRPIPTPVPEQVTPTEKPNIVVTMPAANSTISSPVTVAGEARVFENAFSIRIQDQNGTTITEVHAMAHSQDMGQFGPFSESVPFKKHAGKNGSIEVFSNSAKDGEEINKVIIPVQFSP